MNQADVKALLDDLQEKWPIIEAVSFDELNIQEKLSNQPYEIMRYQNEYIKAKSRMDELMDIKNRLVGQKYDHFRFNSDKALTAKEIENYYIPRDVDVIRVNAAISKQQVIVDYFDVCVRAINQMQWQIKLYLEDRRYSS